MTTFLIVIGFILLAAFLIGEEGDMSDHSDEELLDELNHRHDDLS